MSIINYGVIVILFVVYFCWTWNNTKDYETNFHRILYTVIGTGIIALGTYIIFLISKRGINYPYVEMIGKVRNIILLIFVPINGFIISPQIARTIGRIKKDNITNEELKRKIILFIIITIIVITIECSYFKNIQNGIIAQFNIK